MDWASRFHSTISYQTKAGYSDGDLTWNTIATAKGRLQQASVTLRSFGGEELTTSHVFYTADSSIEEGSRVWLPGRTTSDVSESLPVLRIQESYMLDNSYTLRKVWIGR